MPKRLDEPQIAVLPCGSLGSRYGGFKQVDRVGPSGEMLLEYAVFDARRAGFRRVVFIIRDWRSQIVVLIGAILLVIGGW